MNNKISVSDIYESQIQKARDSSRINDLYSLQSALEQSYQDNAEYPTKANFKEMISVYMYSSAEDPLKNVEINGCKF
ncbi:hypothetical protein LDC_1606 [sediment metagenome]|uniref:Uncharacterized protein n=1 Tax=sediment metagenome TaxID=749907 RepID=D9PJ97_9ZZZZ